MASSPTPATCANGRGIAGSMGHPLSCVLPRWLPSPLAATEQAPLVGATSGGGCSSVCHRPRLWAGDARPVSPRLPLCETHSLWRGRGFHKQRISVDRLATALLQPACDGGAPGVGVAESVCRVVILAYLSLMRSKARGPMQPSMQDQGAGSGKNLTVTWCFDPPS